MEFDLRSQVNDKFFVDDSDQEYVNILKCVSRYLVLYGGAGSGKSHAIVQKLLLRILKAIKHGYKEKFIALRKTSPAVRRSVFALFNEYIDAWNLRHLVKTNKTNLSFEWLGGSEILCLGLDDPEKLKSIAGVTSAWLEETTEFNTNDLTQVDLRIRGETPSYKQIILSFNPVDIYSFLNKRFCEDSDPDATVIHSTYKDNKFIDDQYADVLEGLRERDPTLAKIYADGLWAELQNIIYSNWTIVTDADWPAEFDERIYGLDFGWNSPTGLLEIGFKDEEVYAKELVYEAKLSNPDLIIKMQEAGINSNDYIYADPARPDLIDAIYNAGFNIDKGDNTVKAGIDFVKVRRIHVHGGSENHIKEKRSYKYKEDRNGNVLEDPVKAYDHLQDAERYALYTHLANRNEPQIWSPSDVSESTKHDDSESKFLW